jgi:DNA-binding transcriptional MerR regulator
MRISELSRRSGVAISAIKYYQREGLLPEGERSSPTQVSYGIPHVERVRLVRALIETGGLSVAAVKAVISAIDDEDAPLATTFAVAQHAMGAPRTAESSASEHSRDAVRDLARALEWRFSDDNPGFDTAGRALDGLSAIHFAPSLDYLRAYADAAASVAVADLEALSTRSGRDATAELMVVGTVLGDPLFAGLRRIAHEDATSALFSLSDQERD